MSAAVISQLQWVHCHRCDVLTRGHLQGGLLPCCWLCECNDMVEVTDEDVHEERSWPS